METGNVSIDESDTKYYFNDEESYLFFTPVKYTDWMMVKVVPCQPVDAVGLYYTFDVAIMIFLAMLVLLAINYFYIKSRNS